MTTTLRNAAGVDRGRHLAGASRGTGTGIGAPTRLDSALGRMRRRISVLPLVVGLAIIVGATLGTAALLSQRGTVTTVWVAARDIEADTPVAGDAITTLEVSGPVDFGHYDAAAMTRDAVLAAVPRIDIAAGTPLAPGQFHDGPDPVGLPPGMLTVAVVVRGSHLPANLARGDTVLLVGVPASARPDSTAEGWPGTAPVLQDATVVAIDDPGTTPEVTVTVSVPRDVVADIAWLAGQEQLVIARDR